MLFAEPRLRKRLEELHGERPGRSAGTRPPAPGAPAPPAASRSPPRCPSHLLTPPNAHRSSLAGYQAAGHPRRRRGSAERPPSSSPRVSSTPRGTERRGGPSGFTVLATPAPALAALRYLSEAHAGMSNHADATGSPGALWGRGFRPFFLGAGVYGALFVVAGRRSGAARFPAPAWLTPLAWHGHEMVFGLAAAAIAGFTTTAVPACDRTRCARGRPLQALFALWAAGRLAMLAAGMLPAGLAAAVDVAFLPALAAVLARHLAGTGSGATTASSPSSTCSHSPTRPSTRRPWARRGLGLARPALHRRPRRRPRRRDRRTHHARLHHERAEPARRAEPSCGARLPSTGSPSSPWRRRRGRRPRRSARRRERRPRRRRGPGRRSAHGRLADARRRGATRWSRSSTRAWLGWRSGSCSSAPATSALRCPQRQASTPSPRARSAR